MSAKIRAAGIGLFVLMMISLGIGMAIFVGNGELWGQNIQRYELVFNSSVNGLEIGAPVTLKGVRIGEVSSVKARFYPKSNTPLNSISIDINPDLIHFIQETDSSLEDILLYSDFSAKLKTQSLLTGLLYVELDVYNDPPQTILVDTIYPQIPTVPSDLEKLNDFNAVDFVGMADDLQKTLKNLHQFTASDEFHKIPTQLNETLVAIEDSAKTIGASANDVSGDMQQAVASLKKSMVSVQQATAKINAHMSEDSPLIYNLNESLERIGRAATAVKQLAEMLERNPEALITGKKESAWEK